MAQFASHASTAPSEPAGPAGEQEEEIADEAEAGMTADPAAVRLSRADAARVLSTSRRVRRGG